MKNKNITVNFKEAKEDWEEVFKDYHEREMTDIDWKVLRELFDSQNWLGQMQCDVEWHIANSKYFKGG